MLRSSALRSPGSLLQHRHSTEQGGASEEKDASQKMPACSQFKDQGTKQYVCTPRSSPTKTHTYMGTRARRAIRKKHAPNARVLFSRSEKDLLLFACFSYFNWSVPGLERWGGHGREDSTFCRKCCHRLCRRQRQYLPNVLGCVTHHTSHCTSRNSP